jgi:hypothetical protein
MDNSSCFYITVGTDIKVTLHSVRPGGKVNWPINQMRDS